MTSLTRIHGLLLRKQIVGRRRGSCKKSHKISAESKSRYDNTKQVGAGEMMGRTGYG